MNTWTNEELWRIYAMKNLNYPIDTPWYILKTHSVYFIHMPSICPSSETNPSHQKNNILSTNSTDSWLKPASIGMGFNPSEIVIVKVWDSKQETLFHYEHKAHEILSHSIKIKIPNILFKFQHPSKLFSMIGYSYGGQSVLYEIMNHKPETYDKIEQIGRSIGQLLRQLHEYKIIEKWDISYLHPNSKYFRVREWAKIHIPIILAQFENDPSPLGYIHGDTNLGNYLIPFFNKSSDIIGDLMLIDYSGIAEHDQKGLPCYEYHQFISSVLRQLESIPPNELSRFDMSPSTKTTVIKTEDNNQHLSDALFNGFFATYPLSCFPDVTHQLMYSYWSERRRT